jgi:flagellar biosynthetic protein FliP
MKSRFGILIILLLLCVISPVAAQAPAIPDIALRIGAGGGEVQDVSNSLQILFMLTVLSLAPAIVMLTTSFSRIVIVLGFTRHALGTQQIPPNSVLIGLALFLTAFTMAPVWQNVDQQAVQPYLAKQISYKDALTRAIYPIRAFMFRQTRESDLTLFVEMAHIDKPRTQADIPSWVLVPAFVVGELRTAFTMGFLIFIPFVVIDLVVATILMSMGMMMMPPVLISLPCKIMLFVLIDGWALIAQSLVHSFH